MTNESKAKPEKAAKAETPAAEESEQKPEAVEATKKSAASDQAAEDSLAKEESPTKPEPESAPEPAEAASAAEGPADSADEDPAESDPDPNPDEGGEDAKSAELEALQAELADLKDRLLRAAAEMENMRRRFERDMSDARQYAVTGFAREVLSIGDNLGRALSAVPDEARKESEAMATLLEGVEMTERELLRVLDRHNVKRLEPHGEKFDPNFHQAMFEVEHDEAPHGTVVQVMQPGYSIGERVLRPAMVGVARKKKNAEKPAEKAPSEAAGNEGESSAASADSASES